MSEKSGRALFVIGMHRSGTSALTRVLSLAGAGLPADLMESSPHNPKGHWEPRPVADMNEHILNMLGVRWHTPFPLVRTPAVNAALQGFKDAARDLLEQQFGRQSLIVFKEPRSTILADFWHEVLEELDYEPLTILMVRDPREVASSLASRDGIPCNHGLLLWANYMAQAEILTRGRRRTSCSYEELLARPHSVVERIERDLGIAMPFRTSAQQQIDAFLQDDLRHHRSDVSLPGETALSPVWRLAAWLATGLGSHEQEEDVPAAVLSWLEGLGQIFGPIIAENDLALSTERIRLRRRNLADEQARKILDDIGSALQRYVGALDEVRQGVAGMAGPSTEQDSESGRAYRFDPARYLALHPDVEQSGIDPLEHYRRSGRREGRAI